MVGARFETLKPDPVTELPLAHQLGEDDEEAAISSLAEFSFTTERKTANWQFMMRPTTFHFSYHVYAV